MPTSNTAPTYKFIATAKAGKVHTITGVAEEDTQSSCSVVRKNAGVWASRKSLSAEAAMDLNCCERCGTFVKAKRQADTPEKRKAERAAKRDETLAKMADEHTKRADKAEAASKVTWYLSDDGKGWTTDKAQALLGDDGEPVRTAQRPKGKRPAAPKGTAAGKAKQQANLQRGSKPKAEKKPATPRVPKKTIAGTMSVAKAGSEDPAADKANLLAEFAMEYGWQAAVAKDKKTGHWVMAAKKDPQAITAYFIDGKYDINRHAEITVGSWSGKLRGAHAVRRQLEGTNPVFANPGKGRSGPRKKVADEPDDDAPRLPFKLDASDDDVINALIGKKVVWRNGTTNTKHEARVSTKPKMKPKITKHPQKPERRIVAFYVVDGVSDGEEVLGKEVNIALDRIVRVA